MKSNTLSQTIIPSVYGELIDKKSQRAFLENLITAQETSNKHFTVFAMEAGGGKSVETNRIIGDYIKSGGTRKFLIVKKFDDDVMECAATINEISDNHKAAIGVIAATWKDLKLNASILVDYQVVVITHRRYSDLSINIVDKEFFKAERHTLIIDEHIDSPFSTFTDSLRRDAMKIVVSKLPYELEHIASSLCVQAMYELEKYSSTNNSVEKIPSCVDLEKIEQFVTLYKQSERMLSTDEKEVMRKFIALLFSLSTTNVFYCGKQISALDPRIARWKLDNNIILDANGNIDKQYIYAPDVKEIAVMPRLLDYSQTTVHPIIFNSSKRNISTCKQFIPITCSKILSYKHADARILIVADKGNEPKFVKELNKLGINYIGVGDDFHNEDIAITHFGDFLGKNHWREFNEIWIVASNIWHMEQYPLSLCFHSQQELILEKLSMSGRNGSGYYFTDPTIHEVMHSLIVANIYQACKRINRYDKPKQSDIFIVNGDITVIESVTREFLNAKLGASITLEGITKDSTKATKKLKRTYADKLVDKITELGEGTHNKYVLCKAINCSSANFGRELKKARIKLQPLYNIIDQGTSIEVFKLCA